MERRQYGRYNLQAPLTFSWKDPRGVRQRRKGVLSNVSGGGVFVSTCDSPPQGTRIWFRVCFQSVFADVRLILRAAAQVVRVALAAPTEGRAGFAAAIETFTLHNEEKKLTDYGAPGKGSKTRST